MTSALGAAPIPTLTESGHDLRTAVANLNKSLESAYEHYFELQEQGTAVDPAQYVAGFPAFKTELYRMLAVHDFVESHLTDEDPDWPAAGDQFDSFRLECELGRGGIARVYKASDTAVGNRPMVLKVAPVGNGEAATQGRIDHPNIVPVYSVAFERDSDLAAVCMPYLGQATLQGVAEKLFAGEPPQKASAILNAIAELEEQSTAGNIASPDRPAPRVLRTESYVDGVRWLALQLADALAFVHGCGICHQDLKPSNILMRRDGTPMLMDFNLAAAFQSPSVRIGGTPAYMPPELLAAAQPSGVVKARLPDARSDLFSLGVILYQLLTGKYPFGLLPAGLQGRELIPILLERQHQGFEPIWKLRPDADRTLASIVEACLAFRREDRPSSAAAIARALRRSNGFRSHAVRWLSRRRKWVAVACLFFATVAAAGAYRISNQPAAAVTYAQLGDNALAAGEFRAAAAHYTESLRDDSEQPEILWARGKAYLGLAESEPSKYALAGADFDSAERMQPSGKYKAFLAYSYQKRRQGTVAMHLYEQALQTGIETGGIHNNLGLLYFTNDDTDLSAKHLAKALRLRPDLAAAHYNTAIICLSLAMRPETPPTEQQILLLKGITHAKRTAQVSPMTAGLAYTGGVLCARAAHFDQSWCEPAVKFLAEAADRGWDTSNWTREQSFAKLIDMDTFRQLVSRPVVDGKHVTDTERVAILD